MIKTNDKQDQNPIKKTDSMQSNPEVSPTEAIKKPTDRKKDEGKSATIEEDKKISSTLKEMIVQVTEKGEKLVRTSAAAVGDFTAHTAHQAKLKLEIHNLRNNLDKRFLEAGQKLWALQKKGELSDIQDTFLDDFKRMAALEESLRIREAEAEGKLKAPAEGEK